MKKIFTYACVFAMAITTAFTTSCSKDDSKSTQNSQQLSKGDEFLKNVLRVNLNNTINPTYKKLSDGCDKLYNQLSSMTPGQITQEQVNKACETFLDARSAYESSEAFLLGAAAHFNIDPHIDSWPLNLQGLHNYLLGDASDAVEDPSMLGFHGIEFILFRNGAPRKAAELNGNDTYKEGTLDFTQFTGAKELAYATTVAKDLRNNVFRLECSWNENAAKERFAVLDELEIGYTNDFNKSYGYNLLHAGEAHESSYRSVKHAVSSVLAGDGGMAAIADEVGNVKLHNPFSGEDVNYIESPYSQKSLIDFQNNIKSIANCWYGGVEGNRDTTYSFSAYFKKYNPALGKNVEVAIQNALAKLQAIPAPFVNYISNGGSKANPQPGQEAIDAVNAVKDALEKADDFIQKTDK